MKYNLLMGLLGVIVIFGVCHIGYSTPTFQSAEFHKLRDNFRIADHILGTIHSSSLSVCAVICLISSRCVSLSYQKSQHICEMHNASSLGEASYSETVEWSLYGDVLENIALGKHAEQSSTWMSLWAANALDGDLTNAMHTDDHDRSPWWKVDLGDTYWIIDVRFMPIRDPIHKHNIRTRNIHIDVYESENGLQKECAFYIGPPTKRDWVKVTCQPLTIGKVVKLSKDYSSEWYQWHLEFNELEISGVALKGF